MPPHAAAAQRVAAVRPVEAEVQIGEGLAVRRSLPSAGLAVPAGLVGQNHVIAPPEAPDRIAHPLHDACTLMAENERPVGILVPVIDVADIGVADAGCDDAHEHFVFPRAFHLEGLERQRSAPFPKDGGADGQGVGAGSVGHGVFLLRQLQRSVRNIALLTETPRLSARETGLSGSCPRPPPSGGP